MTTLLRLSAVMLSLGMLGAAACSSCSQPPADTSTTDMSVGQQSYRCGANTHLVGTQCIGDSVSTTTTAKKKVVTPLSTSGNN